MGKKSGSSAPQIDPRYYDSIERQTAVLERQEDWYEKEMYPWLKQTVDFQNQLALEDRADAKEIQNKWYNLASEEMAKQDEQAEELRKRLREKYYPVENRLLADAARYNEGAEAERQASAAMADTDLAYANQRQALGMQMASYGINPTAGAYQAQNRYLRNAQAAQAVQAANAARQAANELGWNKNMQLANLGMNYLNASNQMTQSTTQQATNTALGALGMANQFGQQPLANVGTLANLSLANQQGLQNGWGDIANSYMQGSTYNYNAWATQESGRNARTSAGLGALGTIGAAVGTAAVVY
jgi:hypothetical protein